MLTQNEICDIIQRFIAKKMTGVYRFPAQICMSIAFETGINSQLVNATLVRNGYLAQ